MIKLTVIILAAVGGIYGVVLNILQHRSANNPTPQSVSDVFDAETYAKWKHYSAVNSVTDIFFSVLTCICTLVLLGTDAYSAFALLFPSGAIMQFLSVVIVETAVGTVFGIVRSYIKTMVIEEKYGFNRSTMKTYIFDRIRGVIFEFVLSFCLVYLLYTIHSRMGDWMILLFTVLLFVIMLVASFLYPVFSRIGNKFTPLEDGELKDRLMELLTKHGYKVKAIEVMDASRRTTKLNAYFTGYGKMKTIVLFDNLINAMTPDEICAVFAHELGHGLHKDVLKRQMLNIGNLLIMSLVVWFAVREPALHTAFGFGGVNYGFGYVLAGIGLGLIQPITGMIMNAYSRKAEYRADKQAVKEGYGDAMVTALKKLAKENFAHLAPSKINVVLEYSHPPLSDRIDHIHSAQK